MLMMWTVVSLLCTILFFNEELLAVSDGKVIIFLSTGRCGTQFFTNYLSQVTNSTKSIVVHEPLGPGYVPRISLRANNLNVLVDKYPAIKEHFKNIMRIKNNHYLYIETGWPVFSWIPYLFSIFGKDMLVVHLLRHPIRFAFSLASHGFHSQARNDNFIKLGSLCPIDSGVIFKAYNSVWSSLNPIERSLFQWLEINTWAEELKTRYPQQVITLKSEDLFINPEKLLKQLTRAMPELAEFFVNKPKSLTPVDNFHFKTPNLKLKSLRYLPAVKQLADKYDYSMQIDPSIKQRFLNTNIKPMLITNLNLSHNQDL